jgi:DNA-binding PadR family transcriptional regulator
MNGNTTPLAFALLGLLHQAPASGYDLRKFFTSTPMKSFSDSPGAIYPALRRLEKRELIISQIEDRRGLRRRRLFRLAPAGRAELRRWCSQPISNAEIVSDLKELMLRFSFMDQVLGREASREFLKCLAAELSAYVATLRAFLKTMGSEVPLSGKLALESGILQYETTLQWAKKGLAAYERAK